VNFQIIFLVFFRLACILEQQIHFMINCMHSKSRPMWAWERSRISPPRFLVECRVRHLNQTSFVLLSFAFFAFSGLYLVFVVCLFLICLLSCMYQCERHWHCLYSAIHIGTYRTADKLGITIRR